MKLVIKRDPSGEEGQYEIIGSSNACQIIRNKRSATKVLRSSSVDLLVHEYSMLRQLDHPNIVRLVSDKPFKMVKGLNKVGLQLELGHIDLFHFLKQSQPSRMNTQTVRCIFQQIASALVYLHEKNIAHNDIKLENLLLFFQKQPQTTAQEQTDCSTSISAKLIDFGLASDASVSSSIIYNNWQNRSPNNLPPEVIEQINRKVTDFADDDSNNNILNDLKQSGESFDLSKCDVFQFGLTLFNALFLSNPFYCNNNYSSYDSFINNKPQDFWNEPRNQHLLSMIRVDTPEDVVAQVVDLFNLTFRYNPLERPSMKEVLNHPWFASQ